MTLYLPIYQLSVIAHIATNQVPRRWADEGFEKLKRVRRRFFSSREIKLDDTWSYVKRQTAKMTSEFVFFSSNPPLNHIKIEKCLLLFVTNTNIFTILFKELQTANRRQKFDFCCLLFDARPRNVKLNLSSLAFFATFFLLNRGVLLRSPAFSLACSISA